MVPGLSFAGPLTGGASSAATGPQTSGPFTVNRGVPPAVVVALVAAAALVLVVALRKG